MSDSARATERMHPAGHQLRIVIADDHEPMRILLRTLRARIKSLRGSMAVPIPGAMGMPLSASS